MTGLRRVLAPPGAGVAALALAGAGLAAADAAGGERLRLASLALLPAALVHVLLTFPRAGVIATQAPGAIPALYALLGALAVIGIRSVPGLPALGQAVESVALVFVAAASGALIARLAHGLRRSTARVGALGPLAGAALSIVALTVRGWRGDAAWSALAAVALPLGLWLGTERSARVQPAFAAREDAAREETSLSLERLARGMAHTTLKPVTAVAEQLRALSSRAGDASTRAELAAAAELMEQVRRMVRDLLDLSRARSGVGRRRLSAARVVDQAVADVRARYPGASIERAGDDATLHGDEVALRCMLINLLENAAEAGEPAARVCIRARRVEGRLEIEVTDQGPGIAPEMRPRLFEPFESSKPRGTGLGLAVAREICQAHGGVLFEEPAPEGACFRLRLPIA